MYSDPLHPGDSLPSPTNPRCPTGEPPLHPSRTCTPSNVPFARAPACPRAHAHGRMRPLPRSAVQLALLALCYPIAILTNKVANPYKSLTYLVDLPAITRVVGAVGPRRFGRGDQALPVEKRTSPVCDGTVGVTPLRTGILRGPKAVSRYTEPQVTEPALCQGQSET